MVLCMELAKEILAKSPKLKRQIKSAAALTPQQEKFLDAVTEILANPDTTEAAFMARQLVQCTLPHTNPGNVNQWTRRNGSLTLAIVPGRDVEKNESTGYPFGVIPACCCFG
jgi:hypothetical protein